MSELSSKLSIELMTAAAAEVDHDLLDWFRELSVVERLQSASKAAAILDRLQRAASKNR